MGIIPTRVGTTSSRRPPSRRQWDHPHTRGDHLEIAFHALSIGGSSPHAWGPQLARLTALEVAGIIPTRVGTTRCPSTAGCQSRDHPHTRGDHALKLHERACLKGSSPHAWGPRHARCFPVLLDGIIPTRVGTTFRDFLNSLSIRDHPHTRGDHAGMNIAAVESRGSSPHAWGPPLGVDEDGAGKGIIPTRVGTTEPRIASTTTFWDHPHTRGDHPEMDSRNSSARGSSPHAWGPPVRESPVEHAAGIIPTRVGTTRAACRWAPSPWDHPHTRGDHNAAVFRLFRALGSSPHAWGPRRSRRRA